MQAYILRRWYITISKSLGPPRKNWHPLAAKKFQLASLATLQPTDQNSETAPGFCPPYICFLPPPKINPDHAFAYHIFLHLAKKQFWWFVLKFKLIKSIGICLFWLLVYPMKCIHLSLFSYRSSKKELYEIKIVIRYIYENHSRK